MSGTFKAAALGAAIAASFTCAPVMAYETGDILLRVGAAGVYPSGESEEITAIAAGAEVEVDSAWSLGLSLAYMLTDDIGVGLLAAYPFTHDVDAKGSISGLGKVGEITHLPPTLTLQYYFNNSSAFTPFVGAGLNYTFIYDEDTDGALAAADLDVDDSWGYALEAGVDYAINDKWMVSGQVYYINIETEAEVSGVGKFDIDVNPWVYLITAGYKF
ncbi:MAG: outer membrane beta-barrel protein [Thiogranum sp.]|nr:outer membrane beta-barrel protein [Thiogranum sp.]